jgi:hypothetical protein
VIGRRCNIIILSVHAPCEDKGDVVKDSFYVELGRVLISFLGETRKFYCVLSIQK